MDYQQDVKKIHNSIDQVENSFAQPLAISLWNFDKEQLDIQSKGIINLPYMQYVKIYEVIGKAEIAMIDQGNVQEQYLSLIHI